MNSFGKTIVRHTNPVEFILLVELVLKKKNK